MGGIVGRERVRVVRVLVAAVVCVSVHGVEGSKGSGRRVRGCVGFFVISTRCERLTLLMAAASSSVRVHLLSGLFYRSVSKINKITSQDNLQNTFHSLTF